MSGEGFGWKLLGPWLGVGTPGGALLTGKLNDSIIFFATGK